MEFIYQLFSFLQSLTKKNKNNEIEPKENSIEINKSQIETKDDIMRTGKQGIELIKHFEGFEPKAYKCPADVWTIGYGTTRGVKKGMIITKERAEELLAEDLVIFENAVNKLVKVPLTQNQFDALISFTYNLGETNLRNSTLLKKLNQADYNSVPEQMKRWNRVGGEISDGLVRRRNSEGKLFSEGILDFGV